jgi:hypothetical protein
VNSLRSLLRWLLAHQQCVLVGALILVLMIHVLAVILYPGDELFWDEERYIRIANNLLITGIFGEKPGVPFALNMPLYPLFVAVLFATSNSSLVVVRVVQAIIGTANSLVTYRLARDLFPQRSIVAWLSMLSVALYPVFFLWEGFILTETLYMLLVQLGSWLWVRSMRSPTAKYILLAGISLGLSTLVREIQHMFILVLGLIGLLIVPKRRLRYIVLFAVAYLLVLSPWVVRNALTFDQAFLSERTAYMTYKVTGYGYLSPTYRMLDAEDNDTSPEALDMDDLAYAPAQYVRDFTFARREPALYARILIARLLELWAHPNGLHRLPNPLRLPYQIGHGAILLLAAGGLWVAIRMKHWPLLAWCLILPYITVIGVYFKPNPRYTIPFLPLVFILMATGSSSIWQYVRARNWNPHGPRNGV